MAADQERADRIRQLKQEHPETTWQRIADHVGVTMRAAQSWQEKGGIEYDNAKKLAALWEEDLDYIWRGRRSEGTPDVLGAADVSQLDRVEAMVRDNADRIDKLAEAVGALTDEVVKLAARLPAPGRTSAPARQRRTG